MVDPFPLDWNPARLTLAEQVAQMLVVRASGHLYDHQIAYPLWEPPGDQLRSWLQDWGVGGVILLGGTAGDLAWRSHQLQAWARYPLLLAADIEEGVGQRFAGATWFPPPLALGALAEENLSQAQTLAREMGAHTAREALALGLNWILAPVVDVNNNPQNPVINVRAFGETPERVAQLAVAFLEGARSYPVLTTAKHFPGHGDTAEDSHLTLPVLHHDPQRLDQVELPPFRAAIAAGVDGVMTAHLRIPAWDGEAPATLSPAILTGQLRQRLGFEGLIVTDALVMAGVADLGTPEAVALRAIAAGADILLMPPEPERVIQAICGAVDQGRIPPERIQASVARIWQAKQRILPQAPQVNPASLQTLAPPRAIATVQTLLRATQTGRGHLPADLPTPRHNLVIVDRVLHAPFLAPPAPAIALPQQWGFDLRIVDPSTPPGGEHHPPNSIPTLVQCFSRGNPWRGKAGLSEVAQGWLRALLEADQLLALVIYGSPYSRDEILARLPSSIPYVFSYGQMAEAQAIALNQLAPPSFHPGLRESNIWE